MTVPICHENGQGVQRMPHCGDGESPVVGSVGGLTISQLKSGAGHAAAAASDGCGGDCFFRSTYLLGARALFFVVACAAHFGGKLAVSRLQLLVNFLQFPSFLVLLVHVYHFLHESVVCRSTN